MTFILYRILGNDLPPRHDEDQTYKNTKFILENEPHLPGCEKRFLLNRIVDPDKAEALANLLREHGCGYDEILFNRAHYSHLGNRSGDQIHYLCNVNNARNTCIRLAKYKYSASHVMPSDGGCIFRHQEWEALVQLIAQNTETQYFAVPTWRMGLNENYGQKPDPEMEFRVGGKLVKGPAEPQVVFGMQHDVVFNEKLPYAMVDKVELLWRIGLRGQWDAWEPHVRVDAEKRPSKFYGQTKVGSVICRLGANTSDVQQEYDNQKRGRIRHAAMQAFVQQVNHLTGTSS